MKKTLQEEKQRILQIMNRINEQAFNDDGEPLMTHSQYRDYSEPSEPEYDNSYSDHEREQNMDDIINALENEFNTILDRDGDDYTILQKVGAIGDMMIWVTKYNQISGTRPDDEIFPEQDIENVSINDLIKFFEPYRNEIMNSEEAEKELVKQSDDRARDWEYSRQERAATGYGAG